MEAEKLKDILEKHKKWLRGDEGGKIANLSGANLFRADLFGADLSGADLSRANLSGANLFGADPSGANLSGADLSRANLSRADLSGANLSLANLSGANLSGANLSLANLSRANLFRADLSRANLSGANLFGADLSGADLSGADLSRAKNVDKTIYDVYTAFFPLQCPETGPYIAYKKARGLIVELEIPADALRSSATSRKCRASKAKILSITYVDGSPAGDMVASDHDGNFVYVVGETVEVKDFETDRWIECAPGIHHFITRGEAVRYNG